MTDVSGFQFIKEICVKGLAPQRDWRPRLSDHFYLWMVDHGFLRALYSNRYRLAGGLYRSGQLSPDQVRRLSRRYGLKTLINLRGLNEEAPFVRLEAEASVGQGLRFFALRALSRGLLSREELIEMMDFIRGMELPALVHCKSGADRVGHFSVLYRHIRLGEPIETAMKELHWRYGHIAASKTGMLDHFFFTYLRERRDGQSFESWVRHDYCPERVQQTFKPLGWASWLVDHVLRRE
jgi:protein tyrosine phosphatase (PTP) superfamily phosphohydrolase (DUF442 family)